MIEGTKMWHPKYGRVVYVREGPSTASPADAISVVRTNGVGLVMVRSDELRGTGLIVNG